MYLGRYDVPDLRLQSQRAVNQVAVGPYPNSANDITPCGTLVDSWGWETPVSGGHIRTRHLIEVGNLSRCW